ncbi:MAG: hypothetical protein DWQ42_16140 [Planctomycetota bacterium]|nr:MAG: hypothetical protein DWQ42_16140 [Planctomycetota bacterium]REK44757.1 MAG: hypothetical protein DWQ46_08555 [Planctomycetota bacterium]
MKSPTLILIAVVCLGLLPGCRGSQQQIAALERENRFQEQKIWKYIGYIEEYERLLEECRQENAGLRGEEDGDSGGRPSLLRRRRDDQRDNRQEFRVPEIEIPTGEMDEGELLDEQPSESEPLEEGPALSATATPTRARGGDAYENRESATEDSYAAETIDGPPDEVASITLDKIHTGGANTDGVPGDEGISLLVETRNAAGEVIEPEGKLDVSLIDPAASSEAEARVGLWRLSPAQVRRRFSETALRRGVLLELPWQRSAPRRERLRLFVRLTRPDGEQLQTDRELEIELPGREAALRRRRRRAFTALAERRRRAAEQANEPSSSASSSAPLWQSSETEPRSGSDASGWSRRQPTIATRPTPAPSSRGSLLGVPERSTPAEPPLAAEPKPRREVLTTRPYVRSRNQQPVSPSPTAADSDAEAREPRVVIEEPTTASDGDSAGSTPAPAPRRTSQQPRPWSPYR